MRKHVSTVWLSALALVLACGAPSTLAQEVGKFAVVQNQVTSMKPGASEAVPARVGAPIMIRDSEITGAASRAKFVFGEGAVISIGQNTTFEVSQQAVDKVTGKSTSKVDVAQGKLRVFVSRFWGGRPEVEVNTPTAVVGIKGSEVLIEVFEDRTVVTVFGGSAEVRSKTGQQSRTVTATQQIEVSLTGGLGGPIVLDPAVLTELWELTEPTPDPPVEFPTLRPLEPTPDAVAFSNLGGTDCVTCGGTTAIADPTTNATRDVPNTPGDAVNSGTKSGGR